MRIKGNRTDGAELRIFQIHDVGSGVGVIRKLSITKGKNLPGNIRLKVSLQIKFDPADRGKDHVSHHHSGYPIIKIPFFDPSRSSEFVCHRGLPDVNPALRNGLHGQHVKPEDKQANGLRLAKLTLHLTRHSGLFQSLQGRLFISIFEPSAFPKIRPRWRRGNLDAPFSMQDGFP